MEKGNTRNKQVDNKRISTDLQEIIDNDRNIGSYGLKVDETPEVIKVVGIVDTLDEINHLKKLVKSKAGDKEIDLAVSMSTDGPINDKDTQLEVAEELADNPELKGKISARVDHGVAHLVGTVETEELKKEAINAASKARGVTSVTNEIKVKTLDRNEGVDDIFHTQVRNDREGEDR